MADEPEAELDRRIAAMSKQFSRNVRGLAANPPLRDALLRACLKDLVWELYFELPESRDALCGELQELAVSIKRTIAEQGLDSRRLA